MNGDKPSAPDGKQTVLFDVLSYERFRGLDKNNGQIGEEVMKTRVGEGVVIRVKLTEPVYCYLIAFNCDGKEQLLWPCDEATARGLDHREPPLTERLFSYPPPKPARKGGVPEPRRFVLDDDPEGGWQAFLVVASRQQLPAYRAWRQGREDPPWQKGPASGGVRRSSGDTLDLVQPNMGRQRGSVDTLAGEPSLISLCQWAKSKETVTETLAFPVLK